MKRAFGIFGIRRGLASAAVLACVFSVLPSLCVSGAEAELISNGDMEEIDGNRPRGWGGNMIEEGGNHFLRLVQTTPGDMPMVYRRIDLPKDVSAYDQIDLSMRGRVSGLVKGSDSWNDARVMNNVKSADGGSFLVTNDKNAGLLTDVVIDPDSPFLTAGTVSEARLVDYPKGAVYGSNISTVGRFVSPDKVLRCTDTLLRLCTGTSVPVSVRHMLDTVGHL